MRRHVATHAREMLSGDLRAFGGPSVCEEIAGRIRVEQISIILQYLSWMMFANIFNAVIFVAAFWNLPQRMLALAWAGLVTVLGLFHAIKDKLKRTIPPTFVSGRAVRRATANALFFGALWALLPMVFFPAAPAGVQVIIACLCVGMLGGGAFAYGSLPIAALAFMAPIVTALTAVALWSGEAAYLFVVLLLVIYVGVLLRGVVVNAIKLTQRLLSQIETESEVRRDPLTHLPNRIAFREELENAFSRLQRLGERFAVLYLDLDGFKAVNDEMGHAAGDILLIKVASRLKGCAREPNRVARLSGDEFAIIAVGVDQPDDALALAEGITDAFRLPFNIDGAEVRSKVSIGIALAPDDGADRETLVKNADTALYSAKRDAARSVQIFDPRCDAEARERRAIANDLRVALENGELHLVFQPLLSVAEQKIVGCEALLRWSHPSRGAVMPLEFIQIAEETQLIHAIGEWVLREACRVAAQWPRDTKIAVNFSAMQIRKASTLPTVVNALADAGIAPSRLEIEVTESILISEDESALATLNALRHLGVHIALDDFGTGYSSLSYLRKLPLDRVKIDGSFIARLFDSPDCASIVKSVIGLARDLGMSVTAEGVETKQQLAWLRSMRCAEMQGNLFSEPLSAQDALRCFATEQDVPVAPEGDAVPEIVWTARAKGG